MVIVKILSLLIVIREMNDIVPRKCKTLKDYGLIAMLLIWLAVVSAIPC